MDKVRGRGEGEEEHDEVSTANPQSLSPRIHQEAQGCQPA